MSDTDESQAAKSAPAKKPKLHYHGHRDRLRQRFEKDLGSSFEDYELLELLLFRILPRRDTKPIAKQLITRFGSFSQALSAPVGLLCEIDGIGPTAAMDIKIMHAAAKRYAKDTLPERPILNSWDALIAYCKSEMAFEDKEQFRLLFLDKRNKLIADEVQQIGTVDHTPVYPREVIKRCLELSATAMILVHNHPSGDPTPSNADIQMTRAIADIAKPLGITLHDHIIIAKDGHASLRALKLF